VASKRDHKIFYEHQSICGFFGLKSSFQNCIWVHFCTSGLSQICKIKNVWKLPSPVLKEYSDPMLCKDILEIKKIILEEKLSNKLNNSYEHFSGVRVSMILGPLLWLSQNHVILNQFLNLLDNFSSKMIFLNSKKSFQSKGSE
jgi:hypothetical protein